VLGTNVLALLFLATAGLGVAPAVPFAVKVLVAVAWAGLAIYVVLVAVRPRWLDRPVFEVLLSAGVGGHLRALVVRVPHIASLVVMQFTLLHAFGVQVPLVDALATLPVVFLVAVLPISIQGLGTTQATMAYFFARYAQRHDIALGERVAAREAICAEMEALAAPVGSAQSSVDGAQSAVDSAQSAVDSPESAVPDAQPAIEQSPAEPPVDLMQTVRALRGRWQTEIASRGVDRDRAMALDDRFAKAFAGVIQRWPSVFGGSDLDPDANRRKMETIVQRIEALAKSIGGPERPRGNSSPSQPS